MAITNFILTVAAVSAAVLLLRSDVKQSAAIFRRNMRHIRNWLEEESASAANFTGVILVPISTAGFHEHEVWGLWGGWVTVQGWRASEVSGEGTVQKELESKVPKKDVPKEEKH